jgi:hypothetical protein
MQIQKITNIAWNSAPHIVVRTEIRDLPVYIEDLDQDALDQDCVPFDEIESDIAHQLWYEGHTGAGDFDPQIGAFTDFVYIGTRSREDALDLAREGSLVGSYLTEKLG